MQYNYEIVRSQEGLPIKVFIHSINRFKMHWHNEIEILLVLQGTVNIRVGNERFLLRENDLILINSNEIHSTSKTKEDNILLALQINSEWYSTYYPRFSKMIFDCKSFFHGKHAQKKFDVIRHYLAKIVWELNKKTVGYQFIVGSEVHLLAAYLVNNFDHMPIDDGKSVEISKDINRMQNIINYINKNLERKITLQEIADNHQLNKYYLSHFIKRNIGMSFQEYLNNIRLDKAINLMLNTDKTITEISYESGFPSTKSINKLFKDIYGQSPSEYRKKHGNTNCNIKCADVDKEQKKSRTYLDVDRKAALKKLFSYIELSYSEKQHHNMIPRTRDNISVDADSEGVSYVPYWKKLTSFTRAAEGLRKEWQNQLEELQNEIGFEYIRFHGIFADDMMIFNISNDGNIVYNWSYVDELFDFLKKVNIKPFIELGFIPSEIKKSDETIFWWKANISQPRDIKLWTDLVSAFVKHCINRYGLKEVETWYYEVWNEPDQEYVFWIGGKEEYFKFYEQTVVSVKSVCNRLKVGGPSISHQTIVDSSWLEDFLEYCCQNSVPLDFVSLHIYPEFYPVKDGLNELELLTERGERPADILTYWGNLEKIYFGKNHTYNILKLVREKINQSLLYTPEIHVTEWNASASNRNLIHDTCFVANFIISNILNCIGKADSIGYWTFTDINEEAKAGTSAFHGGFGLINKNGLKKPSYFAYYLLSKLGDKIIEQGDEYIVTKKDEDIQILVYNYAYFDDLFLNGDTSALTNTERYLVYENKVAKEIDINISGLSGYYKITKYQLNIENGSVADEWIIMGTPEDMTKEELRYLHGRSYPKVTLEYLDLDGHYKEKLYVPVHGVGMITLEKKIKQSNNSK
ncbi:GH39 family glycosyl hydrolase [Brassicibacter mesophilus]|uniref:GH39 family glycosyl hydrolase n=1 Tax=Brassicibacter mesophilus TaxID=745119 RepID=UPI003D1AD2DF